MSKTTSLFKSPLILESNSNEVIESESNNLNCPFNNDQNSTALINANNKATEIPNTECSPTTTEFKGRRSKASGSVMLNTNPLSKLLDKNKKDQANNLFRKSSKPDYTN